MRYSFLLLIFVCFSCQPKHDVPKTIELSENWQFKKVSDSVWQSATVPGNVHSDLLDHKLIENPFIGDNEKDLEWISEIDWEYKTIFFVDEETLQKKNIDLNFEGLDTYASVYLNDSLILKANNAFRKWNTDVKPLLKLENELRLVYEHTSKYEETEKAKLPYELPEGNRVFTRKAQFQYGWDWGPKLNTIGIWRSIKLMVWNDYKIKDVYLKQLRLNDTIAEMDVYIVSEQKLERNYSVSFYVNDSLFKETKVNRKVNHLKESLKIKNPKRWWPHNLGEPYLYDIKVVVKENNKILDSISVKKG